MNSFMGVEAININIIWPIFMYVYKHIKIIFAQPRASKVYANICTIEKSLHLK